MGVADPLAMEESVRRRPLAFRNVSTTLRQPSIEFKLGCLEFSSVD